MTQKKEEQKKIHETKSWFFDKINKNDKPVVSLNQEKKKKKAELQIIGPREVTSL